MCAQNYDRSGYTDRTQRDYSQSGYTEQPQGGYAGRSRSTYDQSAYAEQPQGGYDRSAYASRSQGSYDRSGGYAGRTQSPYAQSEYSQRSQSAYGRGGYPQQSQDAYSAYASGTAANRRASAYDEYNAPAEPRRQRSSNGEGNGGRGSYQPSAQRKKGNPVLVIVAALLVVAILGLVGWFVANRLSMTNVVLNGQTVEIKKGTTVQTLLDEGYAEPIPGNLLAIDGSVIAQGGGQPYAITVAGTPVDATYTITDATDITIGNGADVTETETVTQEAIPYQWYDDSRDFSSYWNGSIHLLGDPQEGVRNVRTGNTSGIVITEDVTPAVDGGYRNFSIHPAEQVIALTFDDGPWPETTAQILDILEQYGAKATFFTIGEQIPGNEALLQRAVNIGCQICTHSWDHASGSGQGVNLTYMSPDEQIWEVTAGYQAIADALGYEPQHILRAPGGNFYDDIIDTLWPYVDAEIGWDVDTEDWSRPGVDSIVNMILSAESGNVILMHDGGGDRSQTVEALRQAIPVLQERGYRFVTIDELLAMR